MTASICQAALLYRWLQKRLDVGGPIVAFGPAAAWRMGSEAVRPIATGKADCLRQKPTASEDRDHGCTSASCLSGQTPAMRGRNWRKPQGVHHHRLVRDRAEGHGGAAIIGLSSTVR